MRPFTYARPRTVEEAVAAFAGSTAREPRYLGGGTTLVDLMKLGVESPDELIDLTAIPGLSEIKREPDGTLVIGALARMSDVADDAVVRSACPALAESLWRAASQQLRNMARVGGNLLQRTRCIYFRATEYPCNKRRPGSGCAAMGGVNRAHAVLGTSDHCIAVHASDWAVALTAFGATLHVVGPAGPRTVHIEDLFVPPGATPHRETTLTPGELITAIRVPASDAARGSTYHKVRDRQSYAFALASAAVGVHLVDGVVREARIALGGLGTVPWRAQSAEELLVGRMPDELVARGALRAEFAGAQITKQNAFRVELGIVTAVEAVAIAADRARA